MEMSNQKKTFRPAALLRRAGIYLIHLGVVLVIMAALISYFRAWSFPLKISAGETISLLPWPQEVPAEFKKIGLCLEKFTVDYYEDGRSRDYQATFVLGDGSKVFPARLLTINNPLRYKGINFYLTGCGVTPANYFLKVKKNGRMLAMTAAEEDTKFDMNNFTIKFLRVEEDVQGFGPAIKIAVSEGKRSQDMWIFQNREKIKKKNQQIFREKPVLDPAYFKPYHFSLTSDEPRLYVLLKIAHDPSVTPAAAGGLALVLGVFTAFLFSRARRTAEGNRRLSAVKKYFAGNKRGRDA